MSITFDVDDVTPAAEGLPRVPLATALARAIQTDRHARHVGTSAILALAGPENVLQHGPFANAFVNAVHLAFAKHYPLRLTPDAIWTTIAQGFALHVRLNAEALRTQFVDHQGRKELIAEVYQTPTTADGWSKVVDGWCAKIREHVGSGMADLFLNNFSTSGPIDRTVSEIVMMDAFERYFEYTAMMICGIPRVELVGTPDDWREIRRRIELMVGYGADDWVTRLRDICDQFVETACDRPDRDFWQCIYKPREVYGGSLSNGWLNRLFPYLETETGFRPNRAVTQGPSEEDFTSESWSPVSGDSTRTMNDEDRGIRRRRWLSASVSASSFPNGLCRVPASFQLSDGQKTELELIGGAMGVVQDAGTLALQPVLGWSVRTHPPEERITGDPGRAGPAVRRAF